MTEREREIAEVLRAVPWARAVVERVGPLATVCQRHGCMWGAHEHCEDALADRDARLARLVEELAEMFHDISEDKRLAEMAEWERDARRFRAEGDMYGWNFYEGMRAGGNATDILYQRLGRRIRGALADAGAGKERGDG